MGPPKKKSTDIFNKKSGDFVSEMFKRARESGAEAVEPEQGAAGTSRGSAAFRGTAFKLGSDETPSETVADPRAARKEVKKNTKNWLL